MKTSLTKKDKQRNAAAFAHMSAKAIPLTVLIVGVPGSGKTILQSVIAKTLHDLGYNVTCRDQAGGSGDFSICPDPQPLVLPCPVLIDTRKAVHP